MNLKNLFHKISLPLLLVASLCACSRFIEGAVFLDKNANNLKDYGEPAIAGLPYTITRNNAAMQNALTDGEGHFFVTTGINDVDVNFCVQVSSEDVAAFQAAVPEPAKALKAAETEPEATADACPFIVGKPDCNNKNCCDNAACAQASVCDEPEDDCSKNSNGDPDCSDSDCCDETECKEDSNCKDEEEDKNACPKDGSGDPNCDDSRCSAEPACNTHTVKPMQACDKSKAAVLTMKLDVPVAMDYTTRIAKVGEVRTGPVAVGDKFGIEITYPASCKFDPYTLPSAFAATGVGEAFNATTHELLLAKAIRDLPSQVINRDAPPFAHDPLHTYVLRLEVVSEDGVQDGEIKIQPAVVCPDAKRILASSNVVTFKSGGGEAPTPAFTVDAGLEASCPALGESATLKTLIEAQDPANYVGATYTLHVGGDALFSIESMPSQCQDKGTTIECSMDTLHMGTKSEFSIKYKMADSVSDPSVVSFTAQLEANGEQFNDAAIACNYP